jgi:uncharacterized protein YndB with AHSA1/START domain
MQSPTDTADREIVFERTLNAPRELVYKVWTNPGDLAKWFGPEGFATETHVLDFRVGGEWRFMMHGPDGTDYPNKAIYLEIVENERLVYDQGEVEGPPWFRVTVTFGEAGPGKTALRMQMVFPTREARDEVLEKYGAIEGGIQTVNRLEALLATLQ